MLDSGVTLLSELAGLGIKAAGRRLQAVTADPADRFRITLADLPPLAEPISVPAIPSFQFYTSGRWAEVCREIARENNSSPLLTGLVDVDLGSWVSKVRAGNTALLSRKREFQESEQ